MACRSSSVDLGSLMVLACDIYSSSSTNFAVIHFSSCSTLNGIAETLRFHAQDDMIREPCYGSPREYFLEADSATQRRQQWPKIAQKDRCAAATCIFSQTSTSLHFLMCNCHKVKNIASQDISEVRSCTKNNIGLATNISTTTTIAFHDGA